MRKILQALAVTGVMLGLEVALVAAPIPAQQPRFPFPHLPPFQPSPAEGQQLKDPWGRFQIALPAGAEAQNEIFNYVIAETTKGTEIWISVSAMPDTAGFQAYAQQLSGMLHQAGWRVTNQTSRQLGEFRGQEITSQMNDPQTGGIIQMVSVVVHQANILLSVSGPQHEHSRMCSLLDEMLATLQMTGTGPVSDSSTGQSTAVSMQTYTNSLGNYSISYPSNWNVQEQQYGVTFLGPQPAEFAILFVDDPQLLSQGPSGLVSIVEQQVSGQASDYARVSVADTALGPYTVHKVIYTGVCPAGYAEKGLLAGVVTGPRRGFVMICTAPTATFSQVQSIFDHMLSTFKG